MVQKGSNQKRHDSQKPTTALKSESDVDLDTRHIARLAHALEGFIAEYKSNSDPKSSYNKGKSFIDRRTFWAVCLYTIVTCVIMVASICALNATREQTRVSNRPWVGLTDDEEPFKVTELRYNEAGDAFVKYVAIAKNFGSSAAQNVLLGAKPILTTKISDIYDFQKEVCEDPYITNVRSGYVLFSGKKQSKCV